MERLIELIVGKYYTTTWAKKNASWELVEIVSPNIVALKNRWTKKQFETKVSELLDIEVQPEPFAPDAGYIGKTKVYHPKYGWIKK